MSDQAPESPTALQQPPRILLSPPAGRRAILLAMGLILLMLVLLGRLFWIDAVLSLAATALLAFVLTEVFAEKTTGAAPADHGDERSGEASSLLDALPEPSFLLDGRSIVVRTNSAAGREFPSVRTGDPIGLFLRNPAVLATIEAARQTGAAQTAELHQASPGESWHALSVAPLGDGRSGRLLVTLRNRTEEKRAEAMRSDFIANASHELRTPLTSVVGFIETLLGPAANDQAARERFLRLMQAQAARMSNLIDDLLSLSRIEMREHMRPTGSVDLPLLLREVSESLAGQAQAAGAVINLALPEEPVVVQGDRDELYEVFENLIDNAIKYGADGGAIELRLAPDSGRGHAVEVVDHGPGIAPQHVPRLTERFYRVDAESSRKKRGTGLGLAIVKHIITRHRGSLAIRSREGEGTRVEVVLPR